MKSKRPKYTIRMPGALLQLAAYGPQDEYLTKHPSMSFFEYNSVVRCHTNFAIESIPQNFETDISTGKRILATIQRQGDLLMGLNLHLHLVNRTNVSSLSVAQLPKSLGLKIIDYVELMIGQVRIDRLYGTWMNVWGQLTQSRSKQRQWERLISGRELDYDCDSTYVTDKTPDPLGQGGSGTVAIIPLPFWFTRNPGLALPLVALQYHDIECVVALQELNCVVPKEKYDTVKGLEIDTMEVYAQFAFLDTKERRWFAKNSHSYLIEQNQYNQITSVNINMGVNSNRAIKVNEELRFSHPVKELFWVVKRQSTSSSPRDTFDYFSSLGTDMCIEAEIECNGSQRERPRKGQYYRLEQPYMYHSGGDQQDYWETKVSNVTNEVGGFYTYSFAIRPEDVQPSGTLNFSRLDSATLKLALHPTTDTLEIFARNYNVLRISQGMGGLVFSN